MTEQEKNFRPLIMSKPDVLAGKPCIAGTRVTVETILRRSAEGYTVDDVLDDYPVLTADDVRARS